jgi:PAS domain S-box-containing protein
MWPRGSTIQRRLVKIVLLTSGAALLVACSTILTYEFVTFRRTTVQQASTLGKIVAANSTAALAFDNPDDADEILSALKAEPLIVAAGLYDREGRLFSRYPSSVAENDFPDMPQSDGYRFQDANLVGIQAVSQGEKRLGTLYLEWNLKTIYARFLFYGTGIIVIMAVCLLAAAYALSKTLKVRISQPILGLTETARIVSNRQDYSVRAKTAEDGELGLLTDVFNQMLTRIDEQNNAIRESEQRVRAVLNSAMTGVVVIDTAGRILDWNPRAEAMFGWTTSEALGRELAETIVPLRFRDLHRSGLRRFLETGNGRILNQVLQLPALRRDGTEFPAELTITAVQNGGSTTFCGFVTDITERKHAETRVQTQLSRMQLLERITRATAERQDLKSIFQVVVGSLEADLPLDFACICLCVPDTEALTIANIGSRSIELGRKLNLTDEGMIPIHQNGLTACVNGKLIYEPDIRASTVPLLKGLAGEGLCALVVAPLAVKDRVFGVLIASRRDPGSFTSADCEFIHYLSEHVALAAHQVGLYSDLQKAYDDLRQSQNTVLQQERLGALGQMASGIAHDINNAISPIALYTEALLDKEPNLSARARSYLEITQRAIEDVAKTISRMREFYRQREPQLILNPVQLNTLIEQVRDLTRARWSDMPQQRGVMIHMAVDLAPELPAVTGIESEIREALVNLVFNAVDAMPEGGTLTIRTVPDGGGNSQSKSVSGEFACLEVSDTGTGMDDATKQRCLEPFFTTKGERGTGLGLAIVYGIAQRSNAQIEIESEPGKGTTVRLIFPVAPTSAPVRNVHAALPVQALRILIVDDDPLLLKALQDTLESDGHLVTDAVGGEAGIAAFENAQRNPNPFHLVITDLGMPYVDGRRVAAAIKAMSPDTPVVLFTGWGERLVAEQDVPEHVDRVLNKPPRLYDLRSAIAQLTSVPVEGKR